MYVPAYFAETDLAKLHDFIEQNSFGVLVSQFDGKPFATHLPFLLDRSANVLIGHMARVNPHWKHTVGQKALAIFSGPHAYVSPTWYEADNVVPTWNYAAVHITGTFEVVDGKPEMLDIVRRLVVIYEESQPKPWSFDGDRAFIDRMLDQIVGFRIPIETIEGKWKMSQNQPIERRRKVANALEQRDDENSRAVAKVIREMVREE